MVMKGSRLTLHSQHVASLAAVSEGNSAWKSHCFGSEVLGVNFAHSLLAQIGHIPHLIARGLRSVGELMDILCVQ